MKKFLIKQSDFFLIFFIILFVFLIRSPFFFIDFLDSDEATFILKGLAITQGKIPYVDFHNYKPPISGYFLTIPIYILDNSLFAIRFFTALIISLSCIFLYKIAIIYHFSKFNSFLTTLVFLISVSFITRSVKSQSFYAEHVSILLILISFFLLLICLKKKNNFYFILQGCFLGIATLNTPYLVLFSLSYVTFPLFFSKDIIKKRLVSSLNIILGGLLILMFFLTYFYSKYPDIIPYIITAGLSDHSVRGYNYPFFKTIYLLVGAGLQIGNIKFFSAVLIWGLGIVGILHIILSNSYKRKYLILIIILTILSISIILIGYPSGRYLIILVPFYCILLMYFLNLKLLNNFRILKILILIIIFLFPLMEWYKNVLILNSKALNKKTQTYGRCTNLYDILENKKLLNKKIYFQDCHINKFFMNKLPLLNFYHPADIGKKHRMKSYGIEHSGDELFSKEPTILVITTDLNIFIKNLNFNKINSNKVFKKYKLLIKHFDFYIYQYEET